MLHQQQYLFAQLRFMNMVQHKSSIAYGSAQKLDSTRNNEHFTPEDLKLAAACIKTATTSFEASDCLPAKAAKQPRTTICTVTGSFNRVVGRPCCNSCFLHLVAMSDNSLPNGKFRKGVPFA